MPSVDIAINSSPVTSGPSASKSTPTSTPPSTQASSGQSTAAGNGSGKSSDHSTLSTNKDSKPSDAAGSAPLNSKDEIQGNNPALDTSKDFLSTLAALLDEGATIEVPTVEKLVNPDAMIEAQKVDELPADSQAAVINAMLFGAPLVPTATTVTTTTFTATRTSSDRGTVLDAAGAAANAARSLAAAAPVLSNHTGETDALSAAIIPSGMTTDASETLIESLEETSASIDGNASDNMPLSIANENRVSSGREVREQGSLDARVGTAKWTDELAARVSLLSQRDIHVASLRLSPEHLGPLEIQITVQNDKTSVWFGAAHAETRAALEQALPRLRELLSSQGLTLTDSGVFREPPRDQMHGYKNPNSSLLSEGSDATRAEVDVRVKVNRSLLDAYA